VGLLGPGGPDKLNGMKSLRRKYPDSESAGGFVKEDLLNRGNMSGTGIGGGRP